MGHSILIMLSCNPRLSIYGIDIDKKFALPSINYLKKIFPRSNLKFLEGDSIKILNKLKKNLICFILMEIIRRLKFIMKLLHALN